MLFAKLFQSRIDFGKKRFRKRFPMNSWYEEGVVSSEQIIVFIMFKYLNVLGIEGPNYLVFYEIKQACDLFFCLPTLTTLVLLIPFHY